MSHPTPYPPQPGNWNEIPHMSQLDDMGRPRWSRPKASFGQAISWWARNLFVVNGRASRSEYWWTALAVFLAGMLLSAVDAGVRGFTPGGDMRPVDQLPPAALIVSALVNLVSMALNLSTLTLQIRRLHDINRSGWWLLLFIAAPVLALVLMTVAAAAQPAQGTGSTAVIFPLTAVTALFTLAIGIWSIVWMAMPSKIQGARFDDPAKKLPVPADANWSPANPAFAALQQAKQAEAAAAQGGTAL